MRKTHSLAAVFLLSAVIGAPGIAFAVGESAPTPPSTSSASDFSGPAVHRAKAPKHKTHHAKKPPKHTKSKTSAAEDFLAGYRKAYALIYDKADYVGGIAALHALGHDEHADVATLIGYASRKLGRYEEAKLWYERALAADPKHAVTLAYYGMWHAEQGNLLKAKEELEKVREICGNTECREYVALKEVIDGTKTY